ncbi:hypothetical protein C5B42_05175 [Candidatus Cerribacteria bacterium 'Amazon FNV 2010 28 9']|uniref:tRNA-binding domain-containing protein n=1 Tax=Candidatus Cerribacteria bacterium 'Amazon FNV 2010 28 9' TaxID=2081795 RepID=A0A317JMM8_9BACT|nr:MAG: hypothetical protein C5B42_05175 [Candidatus Cerribacteria bacterium 'Amazon FNV 2010 28 9']
MKPSISYDDFEKLDIRIGTIVSASAPDWSKKLLRFEVDFSGEIGKRVIFSGIKLWYTPEDFVGKQFPFLLNLAPKKMGEEESQGMMLMMDGEEKPILFSVLSGVSNGTVVR